MYRKSSSPIPVWLPIVLGLVFAAGFFMLSQPTPALPSAESLLTPTSIPASDANAAPPVPSATQPATNANAPLTARMNLPTAGVFAPIISVFVRDTTWDVENLGANVGHLQGTPLFGQGGNIGLAGHSELRDGSRGIFAYIQQLSYGDPIEITYADQVLQYRVSGMQRVDPSDLSVLQPTTFERLTLITCTDYNFLQDLYERRIIVFADRVG
jgi:LPXTG-site transpeptidase (sortase) family protein